MSVSFLPARLRTRTQEVVLGDTDPGHRIAEGRIMIFMTLVAPVVALALLLGMSVLEDWYEHKDSNGIDAPPG